MADIELYRRTIDRDETFNHINRRDHSVRDDVPFIARKKDGEIPTMDFPFKMSIISSESDPAKKMLSIKNGRIQIADWTQDRSYVFHEDEKAIPLDAIAQAGTYAVILLVSLNWNGGNDSSGNGTFTNVVFFVNGEAMSNSVPQTRGLVSIPLGLINVTADEQTKELSMSIDQFQIGDFCLEMEHVRHPFSITANCSSIKDGELKDSYSLSDLQFFMREGGVYLGDVLEQFQEIPQLAISGAVTYIYATYNPDTKTITPTLENLNPLPFVDENTGERHHLLGIVSFSTGSGVMIEQYTREYIGDPFKTNDLAVCGSLAEYYEIVPKDPNEPDMADKPESFFLRWKNEYIQDESTVQSVHLLTQNKEKKFEALTFTEKAKHSLFLWDGSSREFVLNTPPAQKGKVSKYKLVGSRNDGVTWEKDNAEFVGCLDTFLEFNDGKNGTEIRYKDEYQSIHFSEGDKIFMHDGETHRIRATSFDNSYGAKEAVLFWHWKTASSNAGNIWCTSPPEKTAEITNYCLVGTNDDGIGWMPYASSEFILEGSMDVVFEKAMTVTPEGAEIPCLRVREEFSDDPTVKQFNWLVLDEHRNLTYYTIDGDRSSSGAEGVLYWDYQSKMPFSLDCPQPKGDITYILTGDKSNGVNWITFEEILQYDIIETDTIIPVIQGSKIGLDLKPDAIAGNPDIVNQITNKILGDKTFINSIINSIFTDEQVLNNIITNIMQDETFINDITENVINNINISGVVPGLKIGTGVAVGDGKNISWVKPSPCEKK